MALNWDTEKCVPSTPQDDEESNQRSTLIWASMSVDLGRITKNNIEEWFWRLRFLHMVDAHVETWDEEETFEALKRWTGLRTNVQDRTRAAWKKKIIGNMDSMINRKFENVTKEKESVA